jgi:hypothetical protein
VVRSADGDRAVIGPLCMIVTEAAKLNSGEVFNVLDRDEGGTKTFSVALSPSGAANATHWAAYSYLDADVEDALRNMDVTQFKAFVDMKAAERGRVAPNNVTAFKNSLQMSQAGANPWAFIAAQGLQIVQDAAAAKA